MNNDMLAARWLEVGGETRKWWSKLTDDDLDVADGHRDYLIGKLQERYGLSKDSAENQLKQFEAKL